MIEKFSLVLNNAFSMQDAWKIVNGS